MSVHAWAEACTTASAVAGGRSLFVGSTALFSGSSLSFQCAWTTDVAPWRVRRMKAAAGSALATANATTRRAATRARMRVVFMADRPPLLGRVRGDFLQLASFFELRPQAVEERLERLRLRVIRFRGLAARADERQAL